MPGRVRTSSSACFDRVPLPRGRPRRPLAPPPDPRRVVPLPPDPRVRRVDVPPLAPALSADRPPPTPSSAAAAASRRGYLSTSGRSSFHPAVISRFFSSKKTVIALHCTTTALI